MNKRMTCNIQCFGDRKLLEKNTPFDVRFYFNLILIILFSSNFILILGFIQIRTIQQFVGLVFKYWTNRDQTFDTFGMKQHLNRFIQEYYYGSFYSNGPAYNCGFICIFSSRSERWQLNNPIIWSFSSYSYNR